VDRKLILDEELRKKFDVNRPTTEVCDANGRTVGYFLTPAQFEKLIYAWAKTEFSDEEAERARQDFLRSGGVSTEEALERAKKRCRPGETAA
jgi:hypothetical protein